MKELLARVGGVRSSKTNQEFLGATPGRPFSLFSA
jgi:hypothetical protein